MPAEVTNPRAGRKGGRQRALCQVPRTAPGFEAQSTRCRTEDAADVTARFCASRSSGACLAYCVTQHRRRNARRVPHSLLTTPRILLRSSREAVLKIQRAKIPASPHCSREAALGHLGRIRVSSKISAATEHPRLAGWTSHRLIHNHKWSANTGMLLTLSYTGEVPIRGSCRGANMAGLASSLSGWRFSSNRSRSLLNWLLA